MAETIASNKVLTFADLTLLSGQAFSGLLPMSSVEGFILRLLLFPWLTHWKGVHNRPGLGEGRRQKQRGGGGGDTGEEEEGRERQTGITLILGNPLSGLSAH